MPRCCMTSSKHGGMPRLREIRKQFGARVAKIVEGCTDSFGEPKPEWIERKKSYLREVKRADAETRLVSASDKLHNVRTILADYRQYGEAIWKRFNGRKEGTLWYYRALSDEYSRSRIVLRANWRLLWRNWNARRDRVLQSKENPHKKRWEIDECPECLI